LRFFLLDSKTKGGIVIYRVKRFLGASLGVSVAVLATAAAASAHPTTGAYSRFADCPTENPAVEVCAYVDANEGGLFHIGDDLIPLKPQILQGGYYTNPETGKETFVGAANGETLVKVAQKIPAGFLANVDANRYPMYLRNFCRNFPEDVECKLTVTPELAGQLVLNTTNLITEKGTSLELPVKFHIKNPFLGSHCYIGSDASPVVINFTTGLTAPPLPNEPEHGKAGKLELLEENNLAIIKGSTLLDNTFGPVPVATGCGGPQSLLVDKEFDEKNELPVPAGENGITLSGELATASASAVKASE
jgi:hypothetical protein